MVLSVLLLGTVFSGCGGGGKKDPLPLLIYGVANINSATERPMVAVVRLSGDNWVNAAGGSPIHTVSYSWADSTFGVVAPKPPSTGDSEEYMFAAYNDTDGDGQYKASEFLGSSDCFMKWSGYSGKWRIYNLDGTLRWSDAYAHDGKANVYIEAEYTKSLTTAQRERAAIDIMKAIQNR